ncbi:MAG: flavin reductase family protein [Candidatus Bathyarchaeia archaeon]|jgi:flavin reductase (DIM6/NTAB) family NADH-FMN oxidoreductase RutF
MKIVKEPFTALFPCPVVLVTCLDAAGKPNIITLAWVGTVCSEPPTVALGVRPSRYSHDLIMTSKEFVVNIPSAEHIVETDYCGVTSGREVDKFSETKFTPLPAVKVKAPLIKECPVNMECVLTYTVSLGTHDVFFGKVVQVHIDEEVQNKKGRIDFKKAEPFTYNQGEYWSLKKKLGTYGFSKQE